MAAVLLLPLALLIDRPWTIGYVSGAAIWATVSIAVFSTAFTYLIYFRILNRAGATNAVLVTFLIPVSAILLGLSCSTSSTRGSSPACSPSQWASPPSTAGRRGSCRNSSAARFRERSAAWPD